MAMRVSLRECYFNILIACKISCSLSFNFRRGRGGGGLILFCYVTRGEGALKCFCTNGFVLTEN